MDRRSRKNKSKKEEKSKKKQTSVIEKKCTNEELVDVTEIIHPMEHYVNNTEELLNQVFSVMEKEKLQTIIPPILKGMMANELKEKCLHELKKMSVDDILCILRGETVTVPAKNEGITAGPNSSISSNKSQENEAAVSSSKNQDQSAGNHTLLDILEQEMQRIAYQTLFPKDKDVNLDSDECNTEQASQSTSDDLQVISPSNSSVELVCLDSSDESCCEAVSENELNTVIKNPPGSVQRHPVAEVLGSNVEVTDCQLSSVCNGVLSNEVLSEIHNSVSSKQRKELENDIPNPPKPSGEAESSIESKESFMIQVFPGKNDTSERIVKKILRHSEIKNKISNYVDTTSDQLLSVKSRKDNSQTSVGLLNDQPVTIDVSFNSVENRTSSTTESADSNPENSKDSRPVTRGTNDMSAVKGNSCDDPSKCTVYNKDTSEDTKGVDKQDCDGSLEIPNLTLVDVHDKEEGELTEEETEDEIQLLETVRDKQHSPTIFLSSDEERKLSDDKSCNKSLKRHKPHRHRHKKHKRSDSPETSVRHIDKRGNRSYRRRRGPVSDLPSFPDEKGLQSVVNPKENSDGQPVGPNVPETESSPNREAVPESVFQETACLESSTNSEVLENENKILNCSSSDDGDSVFDTSENPQDESDVPDDTNEGAPLKSSWVDRWAVKKDLKKVVITSKIYTNVRKKFLSKKQKEKMEEPSPEATLPDVPPLVFHVEGSVQEYQMLQWISGDTACEDGIRNIEKHFSPLLLAEENNTLCSSSMTDKGETLSSVEVNDTLCTSLKTDTHNATLGSSSHLSDCKSFPCEGLDPKVDSKESVD